MGFDVHGPHGQKSVIALYARIVLPELPDDRLDLYRPGRLRRQNNAEMLAAEGQHSKQR